MATMARTEPISTPAHQAYQILHFAFTITPILTGIDKFLHILTEWDMYFAPRFANLLPIAPQMAMRLAGVVEIIAGLIVAFAPRYGAWIVAAWLWAIIINLLAVPGFYDVALRDFGLSLGAVALARLAVEFDHGWSSRP